MFTTCLYTSSEQVNLFCCVTNSEVELVRAGGGRARQQISGSSYSEPLKRLHC